jgi:flagellar hook-associated protein 3 FlgL
MAISTLQIFRQGVNGILDQQTKLLKTELQLSSGKRILNPADDPTGSAQVLGLSETQKITEQYQSNIIHARNRLQAEEAALDGSVNVIQRARELAVQGLNASNNTPTGRSAIALEVRQLTNELLGLSNRKDGNGEYLFGGHNDRVTPFSHDGNGVFSYAGDQGQNSIQIAPDRKVAAGDSGLDVFAKVPATGGGYKNAFSILYDFANDLEAGTADNSVLDDFTNAIDHLVTTQAGVGARRNALDSQEQVNESLLLSLKETRSRIEDLDFAEAATSLSQQTVALQAAQQAFIRVQGLSLFNFI